MLAHYILFIASAEAIVLTFIVAFNFFYNGDQHRQDRLQLIFSTLAAVPAFAALILLVVHPESAESIFAEKDFWKLYLLICVIVLICSRYKYNAGKKLNNIVSIHAQASRYEIRDDISPVVNALPTLLSVKQYVKFDDKIIVLPTVSLQAPVDATFICQEIGPNLYECKKILKDTRKGILSRISTVVVIALAVAFPIACVLTDAGIHRSFNYNYVADGLPTDGQLLTSIAVSFFGRRRL